MSELHTDVCKKFELYVLAYEGQDKELKIRTIAEHTLSAETPAFVSTFNWCIEIVDKLNKENPGPTDKRVHIFKISDLVANNQEASGICYGMLCEKLAYELFQGQHTVKEIYDQITYTIGVYEQFMTKTETVH